jgi:tetratricopeptide (TPR) repeat protein
VEETPLDPSAIEAINADASRLMKHGISRMDDSDRHAVLHALECFDQALALRRQLPVHTDPLLAYGLAACLLNRGDALTRLGGDVHLLEAIGAYEEGIDVLRALPLDADPRFRRRLAMAHHNRGLALGARGRASMDPAIAAFSDAIRVLEGDRDAPIPDKPYLLAVTWMNLAQALLLDDTTEAADRARDAALRALALVAADETRDLSAAEVGLKARHLCCRALLPRLFEPQGEESIPDEIHQATDLVDEGLALARRWEQEGVTSFRDLADDLFRFGARLYGRYQPQFLVEFLGDNTDRSDA